MLGSKVEKICIKTAENTAFSRKNIYKGRHDEERRGELKVKLANHLLGRTKYEYTA